jgi:alkylation response protein AidB-like acyl-CoA dehydrogenase
VTGLSFDLTEEQEQLRQTVRDFAERECPKDVARRLDLHHGSAAQKERYLPAVAAGDRLRQRIADELAAASVTEAQRLTWPAAQA